MEQYKIEMRPIHKQFIMKIEQDIGVAIYSKEAYKRLLEITDDRENRNDTWEEWRQKKDDAKCLRIEKREQRIEKESV